MSENRKPGIDWRIAGGAIVTLTVVSRLAAGTAAVALGLHQAYDWWQSQDKGDKGPEE